MKVELEIELLTAELMEANLTIVELRATLSELLSFAIDDYYEEFATHEFRHAMERAKKALRSEP